MPKQAGSREVATPMGRGFDIDPTIVRGYDVRGFVRPVRHGKKELRQNLTAELAEAFGRALGSMLPVGATVAVTSDHRELSPELVAGLTRGYTAVGIHVLHNSPQPLYGGKSFLPTGALTWFLLKSNLDGSVQVTGSHNPPEFNGFKISVGRSALFGDELQKIVPIIREGRFRAEVPAPERGRVTVVDMLGQYMAMLGHAFPRFAHKRRVVVDAGNGIGRVLAPVLASRGCEVVEMFPDPDARFPNHLADPSSDEGTRDLRRRVLELNAKGSGSWLGIALDGDSDRSGFVDETGEVVWPERMAAVFYRDYLSRPEHAGHLLALDVRASNVVRDAVEKAGGRGVFIPAGYPAHRKFAALTDRKLDKTVVQVSAEASGHFFFPTAALDENGHEVEHARELLIDDGIYSALKFLEVIDSKARSSPVRVVDFMRDLPTFVTSNELRLFAPDEIKVGVVDQLRDQLVARYQGELPKASPMVTVDGLKIQDGASAVVEVDGLRLQFKDGAWLVVRISNTSPNLVIKFEASSPPRIVELMRAVRDLLAKQPEVDAKSLDQEISRFSE
jgi:phosphomannomutase / phosphoglucomutase